jgi:hypothetical protein
VSVAIKVSAAPVMLAAFSQHGSLDPQLAKVLIEMNDYAFLLTWAVDAVLFAAVAASALRTGALPRWLAIAVLGFIWFVTASVVLMRPRYALGRRPADGAVAARRPGGGRVVSARPPSR